MDNYLKSRRQGKESEKLIAASTKLSSITNNDGIAQSKSMLVQYGFSSNVDDNIQKFKKRVDNIYLDDYKAIQTLYSKIENYNDCHQIALLTKRLGLDMRKEIPLYCQGNLVIGSWYITMAEMFAVTAFGVISMFQ